MKIILNSTLQRIPPFKAPDYPKMLQHHASTVADALGYNKWGSTNTMEWLGSNLDPDTEQTQMGYVGLLATAYSHHEKVRVSPHDLWFIVLSQIAKIVNENSDACRSLFTASANKIEILVPTGDVTDIDPLVLLEHLASLVPTNISLFVPDLSTADIHVRVAMAATFADAVQSYYSYGTFMCGIPEIEVTGTVEDWQKLVQNSMEICQLFEGVNLQKAAGYMVRVGSLFTLIGTQLSIDSDMMVNFWKDIFRSKNVGSGGGLEINGWITQLFYDQPQTKKLENFLFSIGSFPYYNTETGRKFKTAYGAFEQLRSADNVIYSGYGNLVYELPK